jgi:DNA-directed RNA polymerase sigma subunit (sigma70/sigma32)
MDTKYIVPSNLYESISRLTPKEQYVITQRVGLFTPPVSFDAIAVKMNLSLDEVSKIEISAIERLKATDHRAYEQLKELLEDD